MQQHRREKLHDIFKHILGLYIYKLHLDKVISGVFAIRLLKV